MISRGQFGLFGVVLVSLAGSVNADPIPPVDCACVASLPALQTNACQGIVPDLCALAASCFSTNMLPGSCSQVPVAGTLVGPGATNILLMVMDGQSNVVPCLVTFTVTAPAVSLSLTCASNKTIQCGSAVGFDTPVAVTTCCDHKVSISVLSTVTNGTCPKSITRTFQAIDICGGTATCSQTVTLVDTAPPLVLCSGVNLVPNPGFESYGTCPLGTSEIANAGPWFAPTLGSPDYFNACASAATTVSVPTNLAGVQGALSGQGYGGEILYSQSGAPLSGSYREYIETPLLAPLIAGQAYQVSFYVNLGDISGHAVAEIGAHFSVGPVVDYTMQEGLAVVPQVVNPSTNLLASTNSWMLVQGVFVATGGEDYMTIGNFTSDAATTAVPADGADYWTYYYFDDVSVVALCPATVTNKIVACGSSWDFDPPTGLDQCSGSNVTVTVASTVTNGGCPKVITRTWLLTDACGNTNTWNQNVTIVDTTPPVLTCSGTNLVPNGQFESHTACPTSGGQVNLAAPWFAPTDGTSDYYNSCSTFPYLSTPTNAVGDEVPLSGQAYAGIYVYGTNTTGPASSYREYMEVPLLSPLVAGQTYQVLFYVSRAEIYAAAIAEIGAHFSVGPVTSNSYDGVLNVTPQVVNASTNVLLSTSGWMPVQGTFVAAGGENYLTLGNFLPNSATTAVPASGLFSDFAYYYFEDVSVSPLCPAWVINKIVQCGSPWAFDEPAAVDQCSGTNITTTVDTLTNSVCPLQVTRTWTLTDQCGNSTNVTQTVVVGGNASLVVNCACLEDYALALLNTNGCAGIVPNLSVLSNSPCISGACGTVNISQSPPAGTVFGQGTYPITLTISDCLGNTNTCVVPFQVSVPYLSIACPPNLTLLTCSTSAVGNFTVTAIGNSGPVACSPPSGSTFPLGATVVNCTATNDCGGVATCSFTVTVKPPKPWGCPLIAIGVAITPRGNGNVVFRPALSGGGNGVDFGNFDNSGQDGVQFELGPAEKFTFTTELEFNAPEGARLDLVAPANPGEIGDTPILSMRKTCQPRCGWDVVRAKSSADDPAATFRSIAIGTNGELFSSLTQDAATLDTNILAHLGAMAGATSVVMTVTLDCRSRELSLEFPFCDWTPDAARKGWDGCIYGNGPRGGTKTNKTARLVLTPLTTVASPPITALDLVVSNLTQVAFDNPTITSMRRKWGDGHVTLMKAYDDGTDEGMRFLSLGEGGGVGTDLGYAASFQCRIGHFENGDVPNQEQLFHVKGWPPGTTTNRPPPPIFDVRLAQSGSGAGIDCAVDFTQWGVSNVTLQLWSGNVLVGEMAHVPATLATPLVTLSGFPGILGCPGVGVLSLSNTNPFSVLSGLDCPSGACEGTELRILAELTSEATPPVAFTGLECLISEDMDNFIHGLETTPACTPVPLSAAVTASGISLSWEGDGFRLQGAETLSGPWYDLGASSPVNLPANYALRMFRLVCD